MGKDQELLEAARNGNLPVVEKILGQRAKRSGPLASLRRGPGANVQDGSGYSALHHAALNGHQEIVELLLTYEASPNIVDDKGCSPLHLAAWTGNVNIVRLLLCHGPSVLNVNLINKDKETALHCSAQYGNTGVVSLLLEHGCDPTIRNIRHESALDLAAQYGRLETVETLVRTHPELVAAYNVRNTGGLLSIPHTPLHLASRNGHKGVVEVLLNSGLAVNVRTASGTALHEAALCGKLEVVRTLLDHGADLSLRDARSNTVYDLLQQFPPHVVQDITTLIKRHRQDNCSDGDDSLPPIPVPSLGSPYENVRLPMRHNSPSSSPTHWHSDHRRISQASAISQESEGACRSVDSRHYQWSNSCGLSKSMLEGSFMSEDSCCSHGRDPDQISISSTSSIGGPSSRRSTDLYIPMTPSPGSNNKVSPTPPKKPPRRNLSVSPTHPTPSSMGAYEYLFLARSGVRSHGDLDDINVGNIKPHREMLRRGKSADQYVDMKLRYTIMGEEFNTEDDPKFQPIAITSVYENIPFRTTNPKRKLRRLQNDKSYENYDPAVILSRGDLPFKKVETTSVSNMDQLHIIEASPAGFVPAFKPSSDFVLDRRKLNGDNDVKKSSCPLSPTNYQQPPTPDHPPPSATQAEHSIHERIRPLSQEYCNLMKRRSRDMETETEEELLLLVYPSPTGANVQISSSPPDYVEEFVSDFPFAGEPMNWNAVPPICRIYLILLYSNLHESFKHTFFKGLFKGSTTSETRAERPKTLRKLRHVYESGGMASEEPQEEAKGSDKCVLSPFDEQEEWAKISEIMASFGTGLVRESVFVSELEKEFQARLGLNLSESSNVDPLATTIGKWLASINLPQYETTFINYGYDNLDFINGVLDETDLKDMGVTEVDRKTLLEAAKQLQNKVVEAYPLQVNNNNNNTNNNNNHDTKDDENADGEESLSVDDWLEKLDLACYWDTFRKHLYTEMDRVKSVWEVELTAVLEISKPGHRHRILASLPRSCNQPSIQDINEELAQLKSSMQELESHVKVTTCTGMTPTTTTTPTAANTPTSGSAQASGNTGTLRHSHKKSRPAPQPPGKQPELQIRDPSQLLVGVPSTLTAQWRHRPHALLSGHLTYLARYLGSTVVKELRGTESTKKSIQKLKKPQCEQNSSPDIYLAISYRGVKFLSTDTQELVCEHEIRNIHCACQDAEDLTHFAYITKDHASKSHYCHVFCVQTMDQATEVILTLGQAFEVAYQMALRESTNNRGNGHTRSHSANLAPITSQPNHNRSHSVNEIKLNGENLANGHPPSPPPILTSEDI
ncbi:ankyrin repeat and SAM domain-containing protein 1A-like isoform X3 [Cimex lectularius]|uniref:Ankyrin repeat and sterile alpha motif domain-containing protein 1B n=1 Tax=Cimex lectularius TaxID=79782 RepID=A0A8I6SGR8_CIMLE|nr:ankyrin repeat and SAM domain-containing protein 1A-like isoform X3 [Cimex lectularius]